MAKPTDETNFCRVFVLPSEFPNQYCFGGGVLVGMRMVDWFNPWPKELSTGELVDKKWEEVKSELTEWLLRKVYIRPGVQYLVLTDFGEAFTFVGVATEKTRYA